MRQKTAKSFIVTLIAAAFIFISFYSVSGRELVLINDGWLFTASGDTVPSAVTLPHTWNTDAYFKADYLRGKSEYSRQLCIPAAAEGKRVFLKFDGAANKSSVTIDGQEAGNHVGAYSSHTIDVTNLVKPGHCHLLQVTVDNSDKEIPPSSADFTFMGGLYRDAWMITTDPVHLDIISGPECGFKATPQKNTDGTWRLIVEGGVVNDSNLNRSIKITVSLTSPDGKILEQRNFDIKTDRKDTYPFKVSMDNLRGLSLWSPENPALYRVNVSVETAEGQKDVASSTIGFRTFGFDELGRFTLNDKPYKLRGMCRHQDMKPVGYALTDEMHRRDMQLVKDMGANYIRISHYPQDDAVLEMCDRMGLIAWEEIPVIDYVPDSEPFADNCEFMLREMIRRHYNHPSVVMWGYMNEILLRPRNDEEVSEPRAFRLAQRLQKVLESEDTTRLSAMAFHDGLERYHTSGLAGLVDVHGWNIYQGWYSGNLNGLERFLSAQHHKHPESHLFVSEYGAGSDRRLHSYAPHEFDFSVEYQQKFLEHYLPVIEDSVYIAGASHWNLIDFSAAHREESMPHINNKGLLRADRTPKDVYHYFRAAWHHPDSLKVAHIATRDWPERTELFINPDTLMRPVKVYTNLPEVTLALDGTPIGTVRSVNSSAVFNVPLHAGANTLTVSEPGTQKYIDATTVNVTAIPVIGGKIAPGVRDVAFNVGSDCYFRSDLSGLTWLPDREYTPGNLYGAVGGKRYSTTNNIALTDDTPLYQTGISDIAEYHIEVVPGLYEVELSFAAIANPAENPAYLLSHGEGEKPLPPAMMDIALNGKTVERAFAPAQQAGYKTMMKKRYFTEVTGSEGLTVSFTPADGTTLLSAVKIRKTDL